MPSKIEAYDQAIDAARKGQVMSETDLEHLVTQVVREADEVLERVGGSSRHWVRDCFLPTLAKHGLVITENERTAADRLREISDEVYENGKTILASVRGLKAALAERDARIAELEGQVQTVTSAYNDMAAVLCDPDGNVCIRGSDGDRKVLQDAIDRARKGVSDE